MKTIYTVRTWAVMLLVSFATALSAQNVITVEGSSQDDFVNALESAVTGDTILLTNDIDLYAEVTIDKYVVIKGIEKSGGSRVMFKPDGNVKTRFFTVNKPEGEDGDGDGGAISSDPMSMPNSVSASLKPTKDSAAAPSGRKQNMKELPQ